MAQKRYHAPTAIYLLKSACYHTEISHVAFRVHPVNCQLIIQAMTYHISITFCQTEIPAKLTLKLLFLHKY